MLAYFSQLTLPLVFCCWVIGTTGKPKGVTISHSAVIVQSLAKIAVVGYSETDVCFLLSLEDMNVFVFRKLKRKSIKIVRGCLNVDLLSNVSMINYH